VKAIIRRRIAARKRRLAKRLNRHNYPANLSRPVIRDQYLHYELSGRSVGTAYGGIGLVQQLVRHLGLAKAIDARLHLFKIHLPFHESDHVLNLAYNALCGGTCLEDLELRRQDGRISICWARSGFPIPPPPATSAGASSAKICRLCKRPSTWRG
jgi:hypothetical protein